MQSNKYITSVNRSTYQTPNTRIRLQYARICVPITQRGKFQSLWIFHIWNGVLVYMFQNLYQVQQVPTLRGKVTSTTHLGPWHTSFCKEPSTAYTKYHSIPNAKYQKVPFSHQDERPSQGDQVYQEQLQWWIAICGVLPNVESKWRCSWNYYDISASLRNQMLNTFLE